jgi:hypothetical protein
MQGGSGRHYGRVEWLNSILLIYYLNDGYTNWMSVTDKLLKMPLILEGAIVPYSISLSLYLIICRTPKNNAWLSYIE